MSFVHYFSKDPHKRALFIFNLIAPVYKLIDKYLNDSFNKAIKMLASKIDLSHKEILDIGTGTGAWASQFINYTDKITGIDFSEKMITSAKKKHPEITFLQQNATDLKNIKDNSFDIVTSSYVLHGMKKEERTKILNEMERISRKYIVIHDFVGKTSSFIAFLEFMERSDYHYFKNNFITEMQKKFTNVKKIEIEKGAGLYIGEIN